MDSSAEPAQEDETIGRRNGGRQASRHIFTAYPDGLCRSGPRHESSSDQECAARRLEQVPEGPLPLLDLNETCFDQRGLVRALESFDCVLGGKKYLVHRV